MYKQHSRDETASLNISSLSKLRPYEKSTLDSDASDCRLDIFPSPLSATRMSPTSDAQST